MHRNCPHCGVEQRIQVVQDEAALVFVQCHDCQEYSAVAVDASRLEPQEDQKPITAPSPIVIPPAFLLQRKSPLPLAQAPQACSPQDPLVSEAPKGKSASSFQRGKRSWIRAGIFLVAGVMLFQIGKLIRKSETAQEVPPPARNVIVPETKGVEAVSAAAPPISLPKEDPVPVPRKEWVLHVKGGAAVLRSGPGVGFSKVALARSELRLILKNWEQNWFEVEPDGGSERFSRNTAWIRNDLVTPIR